MDQINHWKRILLQWVKGCNLLTKPFYKIEQSEIETFFECFAGRLKSENGKDLSIFLKEHYPHFDPHFDDDENTLSASDYVYVYSLLLHFSCVKSSDVYFQGVCQQLNESAQQNIATFFKKLLEVDSLTKETLRHAIASITLFAPPNARVMCMDSPLKTPRRTEISPPTPRSCLIQERNKELYNLRMQLEAEIYEKGSLEIEVKQNLKKISKLNQELQRSHQEIQDLKGEILSGNTESELELEAKHTGEEQINRRLCKQISQKEAEIAKQRDEIEELTYQNNTLIEKLKHADQQIKSFQTKIEELALKLDELSSEIEQRDSAIRLLEENKLELENYLAEVRCLSANSRPDLNVSVECLDLSRTGNSSGSIYSPENLGCSVVDIQLREKENENVLLREEIAAIRSDNIKLTKHMSELAQRYSKVFDICNENLIINEDGSPAQNLVVFSNYIEKLIERYEEGIIATNGLKETLKAVEQQNSDLLSKTTDINNENKGLRIELTEVRASNQTLENTKITLEAEISRLKTKFEMCQKDLLEFENTLETLRAELESIKVAKTETDKTFKLHMEHLISKQSQLKLDIEQKNKAVCSLEAEAVNYKQKNEELLSRIDEMKQIKSSADEAHRKQISNLKENQDRLRLEIKQKNQDLQSLEIEASNYKTQIQEISSKIEEITANFKRETTNIKAECESNINLLKEKLENSSKVLTETQIKSKSEIENYAQENRVLNTKLKELEEQLLQKVEKEATLKENAKKIDTLENNNSALRELLDETKQKLDYLASEKNDLLKHAQENEKQVSILSNAIKEKELALLRLTNQDHQHQITVSKLQAEKEALVQSIQTKVESLRNAIDQREDLLNEKVKELNAENDAMKKRISCSEDKIKIREDEIKDILSRYVNLEKMFLEQTEQIVSIGAEIKARIKPASETSTNSSLNPNNAVSNLKQNIYALIEMNEGNIQKLSREKSRLEHKISVSDRRIVELREDLGNEHLCEQTKLSNEVKRLNEDIANLSKVCDNLSEENDSLQTKLSENKAQSDMLSKENRSLKEKNSSLELDCAKNQLKADKLLSSEAELRTQLNNMETSAKKLEADIQSVKQLLLSKTQDAEVLLNDRNKAELTIETLRKHISELQSKVTTLECDLKSMSEKYEAANRKIAETTEKNFKELESLKARLDSEASEKLQIKAEFENTNKHFNELRNQKIVLENKCQLLESQIEKYQNDAKTTQAELVSLRCEETRLLREIELKEEWRKSNEVQIEKCNTEILEQKENLSRLIKEIASIRREKDAAVKESTVLCKRVKEMELSHAEISEAHKAITERLSNFENDHPKKEDLIASEQLKSKDLECQVTKLKAENCKLKEANENMTKRLEKQALRLGESQASVQKLKKEVDVVQNNLESVRLSEETLHRESLKMNAECKILKEKSIKDESKIEQLESKLEERQRAFEILREEKEALEISANELKSTTAILEKNKAHLEEKLRKLAKSLSDTNIAVSRLEQEKVQLNLDVGGLNTQLKESKSLYNMKLKEIEEIRVNLTEAKTNNSCLSEINQKLQLDANEIREENSRLNDELSKLSLRLKITQEEHENTKKDLEALRTDIDVKKCERDDIERQHVSATERLKDLETRVEAQASTETEFVEKIKVLETKLADVTSELSTLEETRRQERQNNEKLSTDVSILQAKLQKSRLICEENEKKWTEEKEQLLIDVRTSNERIKETRLEMEGKLEKMKNKMKTLYNDEITKMKKKQEREAAVMKSEIDTLKTQNEKYEEHTKKLSSQIFRLNENILEHQKQNTFLKTKLKDLEAKPRQFSRITTSHAPPCSAPPVLSSNLHMEDEEGEVFNNTYLSDLKDGRMSELFSRDVCAQELQYRNSLLPPHLKSTYLAQFDHQMGEDEIRETPGLDDSMSTLLNTGQRKKMSGATSYKRPGPPTPSKNAGRLSFGGSGEQNREILKETADHGNWPSSSKTPAKFKLFSSRLSMNMKDERKSHVTAFKRKQHVFGTVQCSSTPRKSKAHIDQRRLLDQIMSTDSPCSENSNQNIVSPAINLPSTLNALELNRRISRKWRQPKRVYATTDSATSDVNSPLCKDVDHEAIRKRVKRSKDRRCSIFLRGNMFARNCRTPNAKFREVFKSKAKMQRNANFNKYRREIIVRRSSIQLPCETFDKSECSLDTIDIDNNAIDCPKDSVNDDKNSKHFLQLLKEKESQAPFEISEISGPSSLNVNSSSTVHSRTIYGASVILNRKIPNVNTTLVRKSSIYVKANDEQGIILVTNQTITISDLIQMWFQMNASAKSFILLILTILCATLISVIRAYVR